MTIEEFKNKLDQIESDARKKKYKVECEYAYSNNPVKIGDVVEDHYQLLRVESIGILRSFHCCCKYQGVLLRKDGSSRKINKIGTVFQSNLKRINGTDCEKTEFLKR